MQVIYKIAEKQRKTRAGFMQLMDYISRDSFKTFGVGTSDNKNIAIKHYLSNKDLHKKNRDGKDRFTYHVMASFGVDVPIETVIEIMEEFCTDNFYDKGFNSFFAIHTDTNNIHCHVIADNVNFNTGNMIHSVTEKQYESMSQKKKDKAETFVYEHQRKLFEDICIKHGLDISLEERYEYMHEQKVKEGRKWLTKEQYRAKKDKDSWSNEIKDKLEEIYKNEDVNEDNIKDIATQYGLEVTRHNRDKKYITFALLDNEGKRTNQKLKLVQELNKKKKKNQKEVTEDTVKLGIKLDTLEVQEKELKKDSSENIFIYDNFFFKRKEIEKEQEEVKEINTYTVEDSTKSKDFEKEKEYKNILENFYEEQEEKKKEQDSKAKALEQEIKDLEKKEIEKITQSDEVLRRLNIEEEERQAESKAKQEEEKKKDDDDLMSTLEKISVELSKKPKINNRPVIFDRLKDFKIVTDELEILEFEREHRLTYSSTDIEKDFNNAVYLAFYSIISRKVEFNNEKEADRANKIMENVEKNNDDESIKRNLDLVNQLILDNEKEYERLKKNNWREEEEVAEEKVRLEREKIEQNNEEDKSVGTHELTQNIEAENETSKKVSNNQPIEIAEFETGKSVSKCLPTDNNNEDLEKNIENLSNNYSEIIIEKYNLYENLPAFKIYSENGNEIFNNKTGYIAEDYIISLVGQEYWDNMDINNIKDWENLGVIIAYGTNENQYTDYADYAEETVINYLKSNPGKVKELELEFNSQLSTPGKSNKTIQEEEKEFEKDDKEMDI
jgi:possible relaxase